MRVYHTLDIFRPGPTNQPANPGESSEKGQEKVYHPLNHPLNLCSRTTRDNQCSGHAPLTRRLDIPNTDGQDIIR